MVVEIVGQTDLVLCATLQVLVEKLDDAGGVGRAHEKVDLGEFLGQLILVALRHAAADYQ